MPQAIASKIHLCLQGFDFDHRSPVSIPKQTQVSVKHENDSGRRNKVHVDDSRIDNKLNEIHDP